MLPGTVRHSDSEKERCGPGTKDKQKSCRTAFPGPEFVLFLHREDFSRHTGLRGVRAGCRRYFRAAAPDYAVSAALRRIVGPLFAPALRLAVGAPLSGRVCPQLPRKSRHTASRQDRFAHADVGNDALLRFCAALRMVVGAGRAARRRRGRYLAYSFVCDAEEMRLEGNVGRIMSDEWRRTDGAGQ